MNFLNSLKKRKVKILYLTILIVGFTVFSILAVINFEIKRINSYARVNDVPFSNINQEYPSLSSADVPPISAKGVVIMDRDSQVVLFEKNSNIRFSPASTAKLMSAIVALEYFDLDDELTVNGSYSEDAILDLIPGEQFKFEELLYAMLLPSANDASNVIADNYPGGKTAFVAKMNEKANEIGLNDTHFADPAGLQDDQDHTTPIDLARLATYVKSNDVLQKVISTKRRNIVNSWGDEREIENLNILLNLPGVNGVKTGFTKEAGQVLITSKKILGSDKEIIIVVMQSEDRFGDTEKLIQFVDNKLNYQSIHQ